LFIFACGLQLVRAVDQLYEPCTLVEFGPLWRDTLTWPWRWGLWLSFSPFRNGHTWDRLE